MPKLSAIATSPATPVIGDKFIGVNGGNTDYQFDWQQLSLIKTNTRTSSYTLTLADYNAWVIMNSASANNLTIPTNASVAFPVDTVVTVVQFGAGQTTLVASGGVTLLSAGSAVNLLAQYSNCILWKQATNTWVAMGSLI